MSTYKELCAVATEMGQPDMIYKFLNLASHHALWNTKKGKKYQRRREWSSIVLITFFVLSFLLSSFSFSFTGAAFAATTLAEKASDQLKPFLPSLVPKLYRYSYDPNTRVATVFSFYKLYFTQFLHHPRQ